MMLTSSFVSIVNSESNQEKISYLCLQRVHYLFCISLFADLTAHAGGDIKLVCLSLFGATFGKNERNLWLAKKAKQMIIDEREMDARIHKLSTSSIAGCLKY